MNELLKLLGLVEDEKKADAQKLIDAVKVQIDGLDAKINEQERLKIDAIKSRDEMKSKLKDVATKLGVDVDADNVADAIEAIKTRRGVDKTEALEIAEKEIAQLKGEITTLKDEISTTSSESNKKILSLALETDIAKVLPKYNAKASGVDYITSAVTKKASFDDGKVVFKNEDGTTLRIDGKDATVEDVIKQMQEAEKKANESMFFNIDVQPSGAGNAGGGKVMVDFQP